MPLAARLGVRPVAAATPTRTAASGSSLVSQPPTQAAPSHILVQDDFDRSSTTSPGAPQIGPAWEPGNGVWGTAGYLYSVTGADDDYITIDTGSQTQDVTVTFLGDIAANNYPEILMGWASFSSTYWIETNPAGRLTIVRRQDYSTLWSSADGLIGNGTRLRVLLDKSGLTPAFTVWTNGVQRAQVADTVGPYTSGTRMGFRHGAGSAGLVQRWDDLMVTNGQALPFAPSPAQFLPFF